MHGKGSLLRKLPGDEWQQFATLRALYGHMWAHPGKQLLFMGGELGQGTEWSEGESLDWYVLDYPLHQGVRRCVADLNRVYQAEPALWEVDFRPAGFQWLVGDARGTTCSRTRASRRTDRGCSRASSTSRRLFATTGGCRSRWAAPGARC